MVTPHIPAPATRRTGVPSLRSLARWRWIGQFLTLDAITGQVGTLTRAATGTSTDANGATITWPHSAVRYETRTVNGTVRTGIRYSADDHTWARSFDIEEATVFVDLVQLTAAPASNAGVLYVGRDDATGNRLVIRGTGTTFAVDLIIGGNTSTATFGASVAANDAVRLLVQIDDDGTDMRVNIGGEKNGTPVATSSWGTAIARGTAFGSGAKVRLNRVGSAGTQNTMWVADAGWFPGLHDLATVLARL